MSEVAIKSKRQEASNQRSISTATRKDARQSLFVGGLPYEGRKCYSISHVLT